MDECPGRRLSAGTVTRDGPEHHRVDSAVCGGDPLVGRKSTPVAKIAEPPVDVRDHATGFKHQQYTAGVIPDFLLIPLFSGQPQIQIRVTPGNSEVFALAVHSHRGGRDSQLGRD